MEKNEKQLTYETPDVEVIKFAYEASVALTGDPDCPLKGEGGEDQCPGDSF